MLARGSKGEAVTLLQKQLMKKGFSLPQYGADSDFGLETENALKEFQKSIGINPSGVMDTATHNALFDVVSNPLTVSARRSPAMSMAESNGFNIGNWITTNKKSLMLGTGLAVGAFFLTKNKKKKGWF